jgi:hypothetical protein
VAKTESTAVTRLIELAQQRPLEGDFDWFGTPKGKPKKRLERARVERGENEVTQVVRVPGRRLSASPGTVIGAFFAGVLTVAVTMLVTRPDARTAQAPAAAPAPAAAAAAAPTPPPSPTTVVAAIPDPQPPTETVTAITAVIPETETETETETVTVRASAPATTPAPARSLDHRPARPARTRQPASFSRPRTGRPAAKDSGSPLAELRINSKPPCQLFVDGRDMGWTPQRGISVPPGRHIVIFRNREEGVERKVIVDAKVGEVHRVIRDFTEP